MPATTRLLTADEFAQLPNEHGRVRELVRGEVVTMNQPYPRHGQVCGNVYFLLRTFADRNRCGHVVANDSGILTERDPDTVRGGDVWYVSYGKIPPGPFPQGYLDVVPDIVIEVLSPSDRRTEVQQKVREYRAIGIPMVCVLGPLRQTASLYADDGDMLLEKEDELTFPDQLPGFSVPLETLFR